MAGVGCKRRCKPSSRLLDKALRVMAMELPILVYVKVFNALRAALNGVWRVNCRRLDAVFTREQVRFTWLTGIMRST
jgi:hypothetical protein